MSSMNDNDFIFSLEKMNVEKKLKNRESRARTMFLSIIGLLVILLGALFVIDYSSREYIEGNVLKISAGISEPTDTFDLCSPWKNSSFVGQLLFQTLLLTDSSCTEINPGLASEYYVSDDGLTYIVTMKEGQYWSDGVEISAQDVVYSIESFLLCDDVNGSLSTAFKNIVGTEDWQAGNTDHLEGLSYNDNVVTIHLSQRYNNFAMVLTQFTPLPKHILETEEASSITKAPSFFQNDNPVCSGMYISQGIDEDGNIVLVQNPYYVDAMSSIEKVILYWDWENTYLDYYTTSNISETVSFRSLNDYTAYSVNVSFYRYFLFNVANSEQVQSQEVRAAIYHALDIEQMFDDYYFSTGDIVYAGTSDASELYSYDPIKAKELLEQAEFDYEDVFQIAYYHGDATTRALLEKVCVYLNDVGIQTELIQLSGAELYDNPSYEVLFKALSAFNIEDWYGEYLVTNENISSLLGKEELFESLLSDMSGAIDEETRLYYENELVTLEQELIYKLPFFTTDSYIFINNTRVSVPDDLEFGNVRYFSDIRFDEWSIIKE